MPWVKTNESDDRYVNTDQSNWTQVQEPGGNWVIVVNNSGGSFTLDGTYASKTLAETALAAMVATW
jgi:hypothetical protein